MERVRIRERALRRGIFLVSGGLELEVWLRDREVETERNSQGG